MAASSALKLLVGSSILAGASHLYHLRQLKLLVGSSIFRDFSSDDENNFADIDHRANRSLPRRVHFSDVFYNPFGISRQSQIRETLETYKASPTGPWAAKGTEDGLYLKTDMPGLSQQNVKISVAQNTLKIKGKGQQTYNRKIEMDEKMYKMNEIKAEMKNGVLKIVVPKVKDEERAADVFHDEVESKLIRASVAWGVLTLCR